METSLESKFSAGFEQQNASSGSKSQLCNGGNHKRSSSTTAATTKTATPNTESSGEKTVSFRKGNDLESFEALSSLFANGLFTDLVICCSGKMFKCHRVVMAAASLYIRDALSAFYNNNVDGNSGCNHSNTVMILPKEIKMNDIEAILRFVYDGHVEVKGDSIESFLKSARMLNIEGLSNVNIVFNNGTTSATDESVDEGIDDASSRKNNGYSKNHNLTTNGQSGIKRKRTKTYYVAPKIRVEREFKCDHAGCPISYAIRKDLLTHQQNAHSGVIYICSICKKSYTWLKALKKHQMDKHGSSDLQ